MSRGFSHVRFVSAGAGSGKTYRLTVELERALVADGVQPSRVIGTTFTVKDSVTVERHEKPVVAVVTEEFETHGHNVATHLGHRDLELLVLPYPLEARREAELREIADTYYPQVLDLLGVQR